LRVAIDTGGTFTDCVYLASGELQVLKVFSTPANPSQAVLDGLQRIGGGKALDVRHGTTVGTNTMLERKGARVAFVTTAGFEDTIAIGRQTRSKLYDWFVPLPVCLVPRPLRFGVPERVSAEGEILRAPTEAELEALADAIRTSGAEAVAISLLFSFANPETETRVEAALSTLGLPISTSHRILPEFREYERASTTVVNAYLAPRMQRYLLDLEQSVAAHHGGGRVDVMQSSGGIISARRAAPEPVRTVLSGPAGGVIGACQVARWAGFERVIGFDMGGTSTDVFLADAATGGAQLTRESVVAGVPVSIPMLDIHTVGAGGGSIARFDAGGMLRVGPESAGSEPGSICFGRGTMPTVTDANLVLGRLDEGSFLGGGVRLDKQRTEQILNEQKGPLKSAEEFAAGILRVVETQMEKAIRVISVERGHDPRQFTLVAFGGGGPLHACSLARALRIPTVLIPAMPGALSAVGILLADTVRDYSRTVMLAADATENDLSSRPEHTRIPVTQHWKPPRVRLSSRKAACSSPTPSTSTGIRGSGVERSAVLIESLFAELERRGTEDFAAEGLEGVAQRTVDMRYRRQGYELNVPYISQSPTQAFDAFHQLHQQLYGFCDPRRPVEIVNLRLRMIAAGEHYAPAYREPIPGDGHAACYTDRPVHFAGGILPTHHYHRAALAPGDVIQGPAMVTEYTSATVLPPGCSARVDGFGNLILSIAQEEPV
jgi:N-methylhydantoinase A